MIEDTRQMKNEIQKIREQLYNCIKSKGIIEDSQLIDINSRLDELIVQWMKANK